MLEPDVVYEGVKTGKRLTGRQIGYSGMHGHSVEVNEEIIMVDARDSLRWDTLIDTIASLSPEYSPVGPDRLQRDESESTPDRHG